MLGGLFPDRPAMNIGDAIGNAVHSIYGTAVVASALTAIAAVGLYFAPSGAAKIVAGSVLTLSGGAAIVAIAVTIAIVAGVHSALANR